MASGLALNTSERSTRYCRGRKKATTTSRRASTARPARIFRRIFMGVGIKQGTCGLLVAFETFEESDDRHGVAMAESEVLFEPGNDLAHLEAFAEFAFDGETLRG